MSLAERPLGRGTARPVLCTASLAAAQGSLSVNRRLPPTVPARMSDAGCNAMSEPLKIFLSIVAGVGLLVGVIALVDPDGSTAVETVADEPVPGQRFQVTQTQKADGLKLKVLADLDTGREYLVVDWGEGAGVTALLPAADEPAASE